MKIAQAIEALKADLLRPGSVDKLDFQDAEQLGIEALERCKYIAEHTTRWADVPLPGETES